MKYVLKAYIANTNQAYSPSKDIITLYIVSVNFSHSEIANDIDYKIQY